MPNVVRFTLDVARDLHVDGVGSFRAGVLDIDANRIDMVARARYLLQPYRAIEIGIVDSATPPPALPSVPGPPLADPYPQYLLPAEIVAVVNAAIDDGLIVVGSDGVTDHGALTGLADDDHPQYVTQNEIGPTVRTDFRTRPDGPAPVAGDDGVPVVLTPATGPAAFTVTGGRLVSGVNGDTAKAAYWTQDAGGEVHRIGGEFPFGAGTDAGSAVFLLLEDHFPEPYALPDGPLHFVITPAQWTFGVCEGGAVVQLASGTFRTPLAQDGTVHRAEARRDGATATLLLPDGTTAVVTDSRIASIPGTHAVFEVYRNTPEGATAAFVRFWADTDAVPLGGTAPSDTARIVSALGATPTAGAKHAPALPITIPGSMTNVHPELTTTATVPASGKLLVTLSAWISANAGTTYWALYNGANPLLWRAVADGATERLVTLVHVVAGLTPGTVMTPDWRHMNTASSGGTVMWLDTAGGYEAAMAITPII